MHTISRIVVGVDLHEGDRLVGDELPAPTQAAISQSLEFAANRGAELIYCACLDLSPQAEELIHADVTNIYTTVEDFANQAMTRLVEAATDRGVKAQYQLRMGGSSRELTLLVQEVKADLLVVGARNRSVLSHTLFGSTSTKLLQICPCPVWVVKPEELREIREIAVCTDLSEDSLRALHAAIAFAHHLDARLFILHSIEFPLATYLRSAGSDEAAVDAYHQQVRTASHNTIHAHLHQTDWRTLNHGVRVELLEGSPLATIPRFVEEHGIDLTVFTTHGRTGFKQFIMGSTAQSLLPHLKSSVLALKPTDFVSPVEL